MAVEKHEVLKLPLQPLTPAARIRVIRALIGATSREFAGRIGISVGVLTSWEKGRAVPRGDRWQAIEEMCWREGIGFLPGGYPVIVKAGGDPNESA